MLKLKNRKKIPRHICYDLSVQKNHNFFANGVCVHNTNAAVAQMKFGDHIEYGSRNGPITPESDNAGFATYHESTLADMGFDITEHMNHIRSALGHAGPIHIYGEWCGGNIQSGVAINGLPKMFVPFAIALYSDDTENATRTWVTPAQPELLNVTSAVSASWFPVTQFGVYEIEVDYNKPELSQNKLVEITNAVEQECPAGKYFGKSGVGEGVVWFVAHEDYDYSDFVMKVKGAAHVSGPLTVSGLSLEKNVESQIIEFCLKNNKKDFHFEFEV